MLFVSWFRVLCTVYRAIKIVIRWNSFIEKKIPLNSPMFDYIIIISLSQEHQRTGNWSWARTIHSILKYTQSMNCLIGRLNGNYLNVFFCEPKIEIFLIINNNNEISLKCMHRLMCTLWTETKAFSFEHGNWFEFDHLHDNQWNKLIQNGWCCKGLNIECGTKLMKERKENNSTNEYIMIPMKRICVS